MTTEPSAYPKHPPNGAQVYWRFLLPGGASPGTGAWFSGTVTVIPGGLLRISSLRGQRGAVVKMGEIEWVSAR